ncbi:MAG: DinB family protein [Acidobacteriota bacterium]|nr:DinB family protein [Acidobacteriota bacterium]
MDAVVNALTDAERERVAGYLDDTRRRVAAGVAALTPAQWSWRPAAGAWSVADTLEHLIVAELAALDSIAHAAVRASGAEEAADPRAIDRTLESRLTSRAARAKTAPMLEPSGRWPVDELGARFADGRGRMLQVVRGLSPTSRQLVCQHPRLGPLDCYQWALLTAAHTDRHLQQIDEIKTSAGYPG